MEETILTIGYEWSEFLSPGDIVKDTETNQKLRVKKVDLDKYLITAVKYRWYHRLYDYFFRKTFKDIIWDIQEKGFVWKTGNDIEQYIKF